MYCSSCGAENNDNAHNCYKCGQPLGYRPGQTPGYVPNYLVWSILVTIFCCLPLGIASIVYSSQVDTRLRLGDYDGAVDASNKAKTFCWVSFGIGLAAGLLYLVLIILGSL
jgi:hypothetical protein